MPDNVTSFPRASGKENPGALAPTWSAPAAMPDSASLRISAPRVAITSAGAFLAMFAVNAAMLSVRLVADVAS
jgi:hypothetical protein